VKSRITDRIDRIRLAPLNGFTLVLQTDSMNGRVGEMPVALKSREANQFPVKGF